MAWTRAGSGEPAVAVGAGFLSRPAAWLEVTAASASAAMGSVQERWRGGDVRREVERIKGNLVYLDRSRRESSVNGEPIVANLRVAERLAETA